MVLTHRQLIGATVFSVILAIPFVTFVSSMVVFPILVFGAIGIVANFAPPLLLLAACFNRLGLSLGTRRMLELWQFSAIIWIGCAFGLARWGDVASTMGGRNIPYLKVLFAPYRYLLGQPIS